MNTALQDKYELSAFFAADPQLPLPPAAGGSVLFHEILQRLDRIEQALVPSAPVLPLVEQTFALDAIHPHHASRWLSKDALALFPKVIKGYVETTRDEDAAFLELEEFGLIDVPHVSNGRDLMGSVVLLKHEAKVTDKGWALHKLIRDIVERTVYCCLQDLGGAMGFSVAVVEDAEECP